MDKKVQDIIVLISSLIMVLFLWFLMYSLISSNVLLISSFIAIAIAGGIFVYEYEVKYSVSEDEKHNVSEKKLKDLENEISQLLSKGLVKSDIIKKVKTEDWTKIDIEEALLDVALEKYKLNVPHKDVRKAVKSVEDLRLHKVPDSDIEKALEKKGWPDKVLKELF